MISDHFSGRKNTVRTGDRVLAGIKDPRRVADHYTRKAKAENYPARSVFKLEEMDAKYHLFKPGQKVLDLGCAPGSWTIYAARKIGPAGMVVGIDLDPAVGPFGGNVRIMQADVLASDPSELAGDGPFDVVLSDMAPRTTGQKSVDQARSARLVEAAFAWAATLLKPGGSFVFKIFQGPDQDDLVKRMQSAFRTVRRIKPKSSRSFSFEIFVLGQGFKPAGDDDR